MTARLAERWTRDRPVFEIERPRASKYDDSEPRDDHGRWTSGAASAVALTDVAQSWIMDPEYIRNSIAAGFPEGSEPQVVWANDARALLNGVARAAPCPVPLFRGLSTYHVLPSPFSSTGYSHAIEPLADEFQPGKTVDLNVASWSSHQSVARDFAGGSGGYILRIDAGAPALNVSDGDGALGHANHEHEWITDGRFTVLSAESTKDDLGLNTTLVTLRQDGVFTAPEQAIGSKAARVVRAIPIAEARFSPVIEPLMAGRMTGVRKYSPDEPRDDHGRWTSDGAGGPPSWWDEPSDNAFARGMTKGEESLDWLDRHGVERDGERYVFYRGEVSQHRDGSPRDLPTSLPPNTLLATSPGEAREYAGRYATDAPPDKVAVFEVHVLPWEVNAGGVWASVRTEVPLGPLSVRKYDDSEPRDERGRWTDGGGLHDLSGLKPYTGRGSTSHGVRGFSPRLQTAWRAHQAMAALGIKDYHLLGGPSVFWRDEQGIHRYRLKDIEAHVARHTGAKAVRTVRLDSGGRARDRAIDPIVERVRQSLVRLAAEAAPVTKYSEDQPRDDHGRWVGEGGSPLAAPAGLSAAEHRAIDDWLSSYNSVDRIQSGADPDIAKAFASAVEKSPPVHGVVFRGIARPGTPDDAVKFFKDRVGRTMIFHQPQSTSTNLREAGAYAEPVLFRIHQDGAAHSIAWRTADDYPDLREAILAPGSYRVDGVSTETIRAGGGPSGGGSWDSRVAVVDVTDTTTGERSWLAQPVATKAARASRHRMQGSPSDWTWADATVRKYSPDEPRDDHGRWTVGGAGDERDANGDLTLTAEVAYRTGLDQSLTGMPYGLRERVKDAAVNLRNDFPGVSFALKMDPTLTRNEQAVASGGTISFNPTFWGQPDSEHDLDNWNAGRTGFTACGSPEGTVYHEFGHVLETWIGHNIDPERDWNHYDGAGGRVRMNNPVAALVERYVYGHGRGDNASGYGTTVRGLFGPGTVGGDGKRENWAEWCSIAFTPKDQGNPRYDEPRAQEIRSTLQAAGIYRPPSARV